MDTLPLFDEPAPTAKHVAEPTGRKAPRKTTDAIRWSKYRPKHRVACDDCLAELVAAGGGSRG